MTDFMEESLRIAAASSEMEGIPMTEKQIQTVRDIVDGKMTLQDYLHSLRLRFENQ